MSMTNMLDANEPALRLGAFAVVLVVMAAWELMAPRRSQDASRSTRWAANFAIAFLDTMLVRVLFPMSAVGIAMLAASHGWGILNAWPLPNWLAVLIAIIALDFAIYLQHVFFHAVPVLWRLHRMHHADLAFDVTTGVRFHPIEIVLSMTIKLVTVVILGAPALAVLLFEVLLNATAMFNHSNIRLPHVVDRALRWLVVTPDMHRVHHSVVTRETNSNFGFNLPWWDRLFGTYRDQPDAGHTKMVIGIPEFRNADEQRLGRLLTQPFRDDQTMSDRVDP